MASVAREAPDLGARVEHPALRARDGRPLAADLYVPNGEAHATVVLAPAMAVRRRLYARFATSLARGGLAVLVIDYRGIGDSQAGPLREDGARLVDWAELDLAAAADHLLGTWPDRPLLWVGHSVGGQLLGLVDAPVRAAVLFGSQSGHWRHWDGAGRAGMLALWHAMPLVTGVWGRLPMRAMGQGEDVPAGVARQWAEWGRDRRYVLKHVQDRGEDAFGYAGPLRAYAFSDDGYAPRRAVEALMACYPNARTEVRHLRPADVDVPRIGHFGVFRPEFEATLWREAREWLLEQVGGLARATQSSPMAYPAPAPPVVQIR